MQASSTLFGIANQEKNTLDENTFIPSVRSKVKRDANVRKATGSNTMARLLSSIKSARSMVKRHFSEK